MGTGVWLLTRVHDVVHGCASGPTGVQVGLNSGCENDISFYFLGFTFIILGVVTLSLAVFTESNAIAQNSWASRWPTQRSR